MANYENLEAVCARLKLLSNTNRLALTCSLIDQRLCVGELNEIFPHLSQSSISQHLNILRLGNIVKSQKEGMKVYYELKDEQIKELIISLKNIYC